MQGIIRGHRDTIMKLGILFPVAIFIIAIIMLVVAIVAVAGSQFGWW